MGEVNDRLNFYMSNSIRLADFFNVVIYEGKRVISPQQLADVQKCYQEPLYDRYGKKKTSRQERDVAKLLCRDGHLILLAVENQDQLNFCMPLRCAGYDLADLNRQLRRLKRHYQETKELGKGPEFLSGMKAADRLIPSITIVFYHGKGRWSAATHLQQILDLDGADEQLRSFLGNYQVHVVCLEDLDEDKFETDLREVIGIAKHREDKNALAAYCEAHADRLRSLNEDTYDLICSLLNRKTLLQRKEHYFNPDKEEFNMCKAMDDWEKEAIEKGEARGVKRGEAKLGALIQRLSKDNRTDDILKAASSVQVRRRLYKEYCL